MTTLICCRIGDPYILFIPGSVERNCEKCRHPIFVSPSSLIAVAGVEHRLLCIECAVAEAEASGVKILPAERTEAQVVEMKKFFPGYRR